MGSAKKMFKKLERGFKKSVVKPIGEVVEEVIEKPVKKIGKETFDVVFNTTDEERRAMLGDTPPPAPEPEVTPEVTPEVVPDDEHCNWTRHTPYQTSRWCWHYHGRIWGCYSEANR